VLAIYAEIPETAGVWFTGAGGVTVLVTYVAQPDSETGIGRYRRPAQWS
jgi:hypothetical protein